MFCRVFLPFFSSLFLAKDARLQCPKLCNFWSTLSLLTPFKSLTLFVTLLLFIAYSHDLRVEETQGVYWVVGMLYRCVYHFTSSVFFFFLSFFLSFFSCFALFLFPPLLPPPSILLEWMVLPRNPGLDCRQKVIVRTSRWRLSVTLHSLYSPTQTGTFSYVKSSCSIPILIRLCFVYLISFFVCFCFAFFCTCFVWFWFCFVLFLFFSLLNVLLSECWENSLTTGKSRSGRQIRAGALFQVQSTWINYSAYARGEKQSKRK